MQAIILVGPPAVGKTTWVKAKLPDAFVVSRDDLLEQVAAEHGLSYSETFEPRYKSLQSDVDRRLAERFEEARKQPLVVVDMTHMSRRARQASLQRLGPKFEYTAVVFDARGRDEDVWESVVRRSKALGGDKAIPKAIVTGMIQRFEMPTEDEGFRRIIVVPPPALKNPSYPPWPKVTWGPYDGNRKKFLWVGKSGEKGRWDDTVESVAPTNPWVDDRIAPLTDVLVGEHTDGVARYEMYMREWSTYTREPIYEFYVKGYRDRMKPRGKVKKNPAPKGVMLAKVWEGHDPTGWHMSEKLDGMRAFWTGDALYSRQGNRINAPSWWLRALPQGIPLDGELWTNRKQFQKVVSFARKDRPVDSEWKQLRYLVFDAPTAPGGCEQRFAALQEIVRQMCAVYGQGCPLIMLPHARCEGPEHLQAFLAEVERLGGEGVMLRRPGSPYSAKRTSDLLKVKSFVDEEAKIVGYIPGKGKHAGRLGAYKCKLLSSGVSFDVGTGMSDRERERPLPLGTIITVKYQELTEDGVPRFPSFLRARVD